MFRDDLAIDPILPTVRRATLLYGRNCCDCQYPILTKKSPNFGLSIIICVKLDRAALIDPQPLDVLSTQCLSTKRYLV